MDRDEQAERKRFRELIEMVFGVYAYIASQLEDLPIPIRLPELTQETQDSALAALVRARVLIQAEPLPDTMKGLLDALIIGWLTAYDIGALTGLAGPAAWRLDAIDAEIARLAAGLELVEGLLRRYGNTE